eukprot:CAMPEP_0185695160 /NCGR_PEP_ID=MMETSP1164-20130828/4348_1 /TAXON_ID=1104430 /ORGANISM="Chrysoreinhardia sp, Strain CCMP2950" /LENGTH=810 /DNA_ID=CAMNT_0028362019 /DNA_START=34 /DNA_END=2467 /DNA_ORIENTATION=+
MPHSFGTRGRTRDMFSRPFRQRGLIKLSTYLTTYKVGDYVDIKVNPAQVKGLPFKHYHGRTGVIYNITKRAVGVRIAKQVNGRIINKHLNVRVEHVVPSKCRNELISRVHENEALKSKARESGEKVNLKRQPTAPKDGFVINIAEPPETIQPIPFSDLVDRGLVWRSEHGEDGAASPTRGLLSVCGSSRLVVPVERSVGRPPSLPRAWCAVEKRAVVPATLGASCVLSFFVERGVQLRAVAGVKDLLSIPQLGITARHPLHGAADLSLFGGPAVVLFGEPSPPMYQVRRLSDAGPNPEVGHPLVVAASALGPAEHGHAGVERAVVGVAVGQRVVEEHRVADGGLDLEAAPAEGLREARRAAAHRQREVHQEGEEPLRRAAAVVAEVVVRRVLLPAVVPHDLQLLGVAPRVEDGRVEAQHVGEARVHGAERRVGLDRAPREPPVGRGPRLALEPAALADLPEPTEQSRAEQCRAEQSKAWGGGVLTSSNQLFHSDTRGRRRLAGATRRAYPRLAHDTLAELDEAPTLGPRQQLLDEEDARTRRRVRERRQPHCEATAPAVVVPRPVRRVHDVRLADEVGRPHVQRGRRARVVAEPRRPRPVEVRLRELDFGEGVGVRGGRPRRLVVRLDDVQVPPEDHLEPRDALARRLVDEEEGVARVGHRRGAAHRRHDARVHAVGRAVVPADLERGAAEVPELDAHRRPARRRQGRVAGPVARNDELGHAALDGSEGRPPLGRARRPVVQEHGRAVRRRDAEPFARAVAAEARRRTVLERPARRVPRARRAGDGRRHGSEDGPSAAGGHRAVVGRDLL